MMVFFPPFNENTDSGKWSIKLRVLSKVSYLVGDGAKIYAQGVWIQSLLLVLKFSKHPLSTPLYCLSWRGGAGKLECVNCIISHLLQVCGMLMNLFTERLILYSFCFKIRPLKELYLKKKKKLPTTLNYS